MKSRIIQVLYDLVQHKKSDYLSDLTKLSGKSEQQLRKEAGFILFYILHDYSRFHVSTIDHFFLHIIRSFTREMGIQTGYRLELDTQTPLENAADNVLNSIDENPELTQWLIEFSEDKMINNQNWNLHKDIIKLGNELFKEHYKAHETTISTKLVDKSFMQSYKKELYAICTSLEHKAGLIAKNALDICDTHQLNAADFYQGARGVYNYFKKTANKTIEIPGTYVNHVIEDIEKWPSKTTPNKNQVLKLAHTMLYNQLLQMVSIIKTNFTKYSTAQSILSQIHSLGIIIDINRELKDYIKENNLFLLADAPNFIHRIIDEKEAPFIYEKTGNIFHHFMIDEFQDTSSFQWENFKPLISNSLSQDYDNLVVGDAKQSIYRWRNSNWEILTNQLKQDFYSDVLYEPPPLNTNYRSTKEIVAFNNEVIITSAQQLSDYFIAELEASKHKDLMTLGQTIIDIYKDAEQKISDKQSKTGYIEAWFPKGKIEDIKPAIFDKLIQILQNLQDNNYQLSDIAILVRNHNEGKEIADYLIAFNESNSNPKYAYQIISNDSLFIASSIAVKFLEGVMHYILHPEDKINLANICFIHNVLLKTEEAHLKMTTRFPDINDFQQFLDDLLMRKKQLPLYELIAQLIHDLNLHNLRKEIIFIQAFQDLIYDYSKNNSTDIYHFLCYWNDHKNAKTISTPESQNAIRIITLHKAKGLQFKAVILPFCNWGLDQKSTVLWCNTHIEPFDKLDLIPVNYGQKLKDTIFAKDYYKEKFKSYVDNLNLLYVSLTRAVQSIHIISPLQEKEKKERLQTVGDLLYVVCKEKLDSNQILISGKLVPIALKKRSKKTYIKPESIPYNPYQDNIKIAFQGKEFLSDEKVKYKNLNYGKLMHTVFERIKFISDIPQAIDSLVIEGIVSEKDKYQLQNEVNEMIKSTQGYNWFEKGYKVLTEAEIILPGAANKRPDRIVFQDNTVHIIDYKFGDTPHPAHTSQVLEYCHIMKEMGYITKGYVWYPRINKIEEVIT